MSSIIRILSAIEINPGELDLNTSAPDDTTVTELLRILFGVIAGVAVLIIVIAGLYFVLSRGNPEKSAKARNTIIYAAVGLATSVLATAIVSFVTRVTE